MEPRYRLRYTHTLSPRLSLSLTYAGYDPPAKQITDHYRVLVSPKKMYLQPLRQFGLHEYLAVRSYNLCSLGRRVGAPPFSYADTCILPFSYRHSPNSHAFVSTSHAPIPLLSHSHTSILPFPYLHSPISQTDIGKDEQWYEYRFTVVVKKGSRREH